MFALCHHSEFQSLFSLFHPSYSLSLFISLSLSHSFYFIRMFVRHVAMQSQIKKFSKKATNLSIHFCRLRLFFFLFLLQSFVFSSQHTYTEHPTRAQWRHTQSILHKYFHSNKFQCSEGRKIKSNSIYFIRLDYRSSSFTPHSLFRSRESVDFAPYISLPTSAFYVSLQSDFWNNLYLNSSYFFFPNVFVCVCLMRRIKNHMTMIDDYSISIPI